MPQCNAGEFALLPGHGAPIDKAKEDRQIGVVVLVVEELLEDVGRAVETERLRAGQVVLEVR